MLALGTRASECLLMEYLSGLLNTEASPGGIACALEHFKMLSKTSLYCIAGFFKMKKKAVICRD